MTLDPLLGASATIRIHAAAALIALPLGIVMLNLRGGAWLHRRLGWLWIALMLTVAGSSFLIFSDRPWIGPYGWIHGLSAFTLTALAIGFAAARTHRVGIHRRVMTNLFWMALVITGLFTLLPGRIMHAVVFGSG